jgi:hypothetical protein
MKARCIAALTLLPIVIAFLGAALGGPQPPAEHAGVRFRAVDIWLDTKDQPLAAYQIEFKPDDAFQDDVKIVGIEGGAHEQFANPPYYDPAAMQQERVIIAAFSTAKADSLPQGRTRIATIHVQITGEAEPEFVTQTMALATTEGRAIEATVQIVQPED